MPVAIKFRVPEALLRWRTREPEQTSALFLARYTRPGFWQRHRILPFVLLAIFCMIYGFLFALGTTFILMQLLAPLALMAMLVVWMLPENGRAYTGLIERLQFALLVALIAWPDYIAIAIPGMPWITMLRLVTIPLGLILLLSLSQSSAFRQEMRQILAAAPIVWKLLAVFTLLSVFSVLYSPKPSISANRVAVAMLGWTLVFFVAAFVFSKPKRIVWLGYIVWAGAILVCLIGLQEARHEAIPWAGHIPSFLKVDADTERLIFASKARAATGRYRVQSKFTTPLGLAEYLAYALPFVLHFVMTDRRLLIKAAGLLSFPLIVYVIYLTDARLGMVGMFMTFLFYLLAWGALRWRDRKDSLFGPAVVLGYPVLFMMFIVGTFFVGRLRHLVWGDGSQQFSTDARKQQVAEGIPLILKHPWGYGMGYGAEVLNYREEGGDGLLTIDSYYLAVGLDLGILGFLIYVAMFAMPVLLGAKQALNAQTRDEKLIIPLLIALLNFIIIKAIFAQMENHPLAFIYLGALVAMIYRLTPKAEPLPDPGPATSLSRKAR